MLSNIALHMLSIIDGRSTDVEIAIKQPLFRSVASLREDVVAPHWTLLEKCGNVRAIFLKGF